MRYRELLEDINWSYPNFEEEWGEVVGDDPELSARYSKHFPNKETWLAKAKQGSIHQVTPEMQVQNTDAFHNTPETEFDQDKIERVKGLFAQGTKVPLPIILHDKQGYVLIGGNTRLSMSIAAGEKPMAWVINEGVGKIVQGVNTTIDVKVGQDKIEQNKFFNPKFYKDNDAV